MSPHFLDDRLIDGWLDALAAAPAPPPENLAGTWRRQLLTAVREARGPAGLGVTGRWAALDRYLTGVAAGLAAGLGTSPASDGGDSDPVILAAGLLAGSAALQAAPVDRTEVAVARAAAAAVVDAAADGADLARVIRVAARAADLRHRRASVTTALQALARCVNDEPADTGEDSGRYEVRLTIEPAIPTDDLDTIALDAVLDRLAGQAIWIPGATGYRLVLTTTTPGRLIEAVWSFGLVTDLEIEYLRP